MKYCVQLIVLIVLLSCKKNEGFKLKSFSKVEIEILLQDSTLNIRALEKNTNGDVFFASSDGRLGRIINSGGKKEVLLFPGFKDKDSINKNFRALALNTEDVFLITIGSPAYLYKIKREGVELVYQENHPKAFYDAMDFWNDQEGIAIGDPTDDCMSIIITRDAGNTWRKLPCDQLPNTKEGEAAFAASDTNIKIIGDKTWIATGGKASRILFSVDKGQTWEVFETPILQGLATTGIYSLDFYDELNGVAIGGDYTEPESNVANKIRTTDGGKTWEVVANGQNPGYRSCVQYIPNSDAQSLVALGFTGIDISNDAGETWKHLSDKGYYTLRFLNDSIAYAAGKGLISKLSFK